LRAKPGRREHFLLGIFAPWWRQLPESGREPYRLDYSEGANQILTAMAHSNRALRQSSGYSSRTARARNIDVTACAAGAG
jgi:hypothetical protein